MQIRDYIANLSDRFIEARLSFGHGTATARDEAVYLVYVWLELDFDVPVSSLDQTLTPDEIEQLEALAHRRIEDGEPMAYVLGQAWFAGSRFLCDPRALVPRSPIAELIANNFQPFLRSVPTRILDLCTGSGCIGIACALQFPGSEVVLSDVSKDCLDLAKENSQLHEVGGRVQVCHSDLFESISGRFDLIVTNPPYVSVEEYADLPAEYLHEPTLGLISEDDGLAIPLAILQQAGNYLNDQGILIMEVGLAADRLQHRVSPLPLLWLEFEEGGEGVLAITASQLRNYREGLV